jgi:hypothetical protein
LITLTSIAFGNEGKPPERSASPEAPMSRSRSSGSARNNQGAVAGLKLPGRSP